MSQTSSPPPAPRWVKTSIALAGLLVVAFVVLHLLGGGMASHFHAGIASIGADGVA